MFDFSLTIPACTVVPRTLSNDPRYTQCIYRYSRASKRFVEVYIIVDNPISAAEMINTDLETIHRWAKNG